MNPKGFLQIGGGVLVIIGLLGFFGVIGPTAESSIFGSAWWFDNAENWAHLALGVVAILASFVLGDSLQRGLVLVVGILGVLVGLYSVLGETMLLGATLQNPADTALHIIVGAWALWASYRS